MSLHHATIPLFWGGFLGIILAFSMLLWRRIRESPVDPVDNFGDQTSWLLLGLLLLAFFGLGALVMYVLVDFF
jgi:nitrate reductase gamma subunit